VATEPEQRDLAAIAREAIEVVCAGGLDRVAEFYDEDVVDHVNGMTFRGHSGARESLRFYQSIFTDLRFEVDDQVTQGDRVATRWTMLGTYRRRQIALHGLAISRFRDGRIIEDNSVSDSLALPRALGVLRTVLLLVDLAVGRVKLSRGALGGS
jgi:predicted ester cyclase